MELAQSGIFAVPMSPHGTAFDAGCLAGLLGTQTNPGE
jgi:hypothetical protein